MLFLTRISRRLPVSRTVAPARGTALHRLPGPRTAGPVHRARRRRLRAGRSAPAVHLVEPLADPFSHPLVFFRRGAHQRDLRIVDVEFALAVALGNGVGRAEIHHVERADRADIGNAAADDRAEAVFGGRKHAAHHEVADFGGGESITPASWPESTSFSIERPPMPVAWKTRHSNSSPVGRDLLHAWRRHAEHGDADRRAGRRRASRRLAARSSRRALTMPASALAPLRAPLARSIEPLHVRDRIHHRDVGRSDIGPTSPDATDEMISFGTPTGRARMPGATSEAPPEPPAEMMPATLPWRPSSWRTLPPSPPPPRRGRRRTRPSRRGRGCSAISWAETSQVEACRWWRHRRAACEDRCLDDVADEAQFRRPWCRACRRPARPAARQAEVVAARAWPCDLASR